MAKFSTKIITSLMLTVMLGACSTTVPVTRKFPDVPQSLNQKCGSLQTVGKAEVKLSEILTTVVINYGKYHECSTKLEGWHEWYKEQKKIYEAIK